MRFHEKFNEHDKRPHDSPQRSSRADSAFEKGMLPETSRLSTTASGPSFLLLFLEFFGRFRGPGPGSDALLNAALARIFIRRYIEDLASPSMSVQVTSAAQAARARSSQATM